LSSALANLAISITDAKELPSGTVAVQPLRDLAYASNDNPQDIELALFVDAYSSGDSRLGASFCLNAVPFVYSKGFNLEAIQVNSNEIILSWFLYASRYWYEYLQLHYCSSKAFIPFPIALYPGYQYLLHPGIDPNNLNYASRPIFGEKSQVLLELSNDFSLLVSKVMWPGLLFSVATVLIIRIRRLRLECLVVQSICLAQLITLFLVPMAQDFRYANFVSVMALVFIVSSIIEFRNLIKSGK
jgi:hypothetical protein